MKHLLLAMALTLVGCGGGSSTPTAIETVKEVFVPGDTVTVTEPGETETVYVVQECPVCPETEVVEAEIVTYYQISTATRDGVGISDYTYNEDGYKISNYNETQGVWYKYAYDENNNQTSFTIEKDGVVTSYTYATYDENSNQLTSVSSSGRAWVATYNEDNQRITLEIDYNGDSIYVSEVYTYEGDNQVKIEKIDENRTENRRFDINDNLIYSDIVINGETVQVETYAWEQFTEEI